MRRSGTKPNTPGSEYPRDKRRITAQHGDPISDQRRCSRAVDRTRSVCRGGPRICADHLSIANLTGSEYRSSNRVGRLLCPDCGRRRRMRGGAAFFRQASKQMEAVVVSFAVASIWFAPLSVFVRQGSPWSIATAAIVAAMLGYLFGPMRSIKTQKTLNRALFGRVSTGWIRGTTRSFGAALVIQTGVAAGVGGYSVTAAYLVAIGCFLVALADRH